MTNIRTPEDLLKVTKRVDLEIAAHDAVATAHPHYRGRYSEIASQPFGNVTAPAITRYLLGMGIEAKTERHEAGSDAHFVTVVQTGHNPMNDIVVDSAYLRMFEVPRPHADAPYLLVATRGTAAALVRKYGFQPEDQASLYLPATLKR